MHDSSTPIDQPARRPWPLLIEAIAGAATGVVSAIGGGYLGPVLVHGFENGWNDLAASMIGALLGYIAGAPLGVIMSARLLGLRGMAWRSALGSVAGGVTIMVLAEPLGLNRYTWLLVTVFASVALIGALWGFGNKPATR